MSSPHSCIHFGSSFEETPDQRQQIRAALDDATGPQPSADGGPVWVVVRDVVKGGSTYIAHHTPSQFTLTARTADELCERVDAEMGADTRYDEPSFRLDGPPDTRLDHGPGRSELDLSSRK